MPVSSFWSLIVTFSMILQVLPGFSNQP